MRAFVLFACLTAGVAAVPGVATAAPSRQACLGAYEDAQLSMRRGRLLHSRDALGACLEETCPPSLRTDCADWLKEVEARTPSVVIDCVADGVSVRDVQLLVDGSPKPIDGLALELDPGPHSFRVEPKSGPPIVVETVIREGEKRKPIRITLPSRQPPKPPQERPSDPAPQPRGELQRPVPWTAYASAGVGVLALGGFTVFAVSGASGKSDLEPCKPDCSATQISDVRSQFIAADVFLGVSVVALGVATVLYLTRPGVSSSRTAVVASPFHLRF